VSVTVVGTKPNGDLVVEGSRIIEINGEREVVHLSGAVDPMIIPATNTIESYRMSDLQVTYKGKGVVSEGSRPGVFIRILNWIF
jgi:flagellar basal body L-ring protein FlgH